MSPAAPSSWLLTRVEHWRRSRILSLRPDQSPAALRRARRGAVAGAARVRVRAGDATVPRARHAGARCARAARRRTRHPSPSSGACGELVPDGIESPRRAGTRYERPAQLAVRAARIRRSSAGFCALWPSAFREIILRTLATRRLRSPGAARSQANTRCESGVGNG